MTPHHHDIFISEIRLNPSNLYPLASIPSKNHPRSFPIFRQIQFSGQKISGKSSKKAMMRRQEQENAQSKVLYELSSMILNILRSPAGPIDFSDVISPSAVAGASPRRRQLSQITPAGFASLLLGISLSLMLCGSVTFFIGFLLMPWVLGLVMVFYFVVLVSSLSMLGRAVLWQTTSSPSSSSRASPRKDCSSWKFS